MQTVPISSTGPAVPPPPQARLGLLAIFGSTFLELVGYFMLTPLLILRLKDDGVSTALAGGSGAPLTTASQARSSAWWAWRCPTSTASTWTPAWPRPSPTPATRCTRPTTAAAVRLAARPHSTAHNAIASRFASTSAGSV